MQQDQQVRSYVHLARLPRADDALRMLRQVASAVKPIMRNHNWRVGELAEFYPNDASLLGLNVNRGQKVCLRLRHAGDNTLFLGLEMVIDTMLHELCHNVHGPHNDAFHALWEKLRDEHMTLTLSGYSGAGFLSEGRRLGGGAGAVPSRERSRLLRSGGGRTLGAAGVASAAGRRLGGSVAAPAMTPERRRVAAAEAAERRKRALEGCGAGKLDEAQIRDVEETVRQNGFRTQAEEDRANDVAIARALEELMEEDKQASKGTGPSKTQRAVSDSAAASSSRAESRSRAKSSVPSSRAPVPNRVAPAARSRLVSMLEQGSRGRGGRGLVSTTASAGGEAKDTGWVCRACTLFNQADHLCCDACGSERKRGDADGGDASRETTVIDLT